MLAWICFGREERPAAESRLSLVIDQRPGRGAGESAIGRHLADGAHAQAVVTIAGLAPEFLQLRCASLGLSGFAKDIPL